MGRSSALQFSNILGINRSIVPENRPAKKGIINYLWQMINVQPTTQIGILERSPGFELYMDLGTNKPTYGLNFSTDSSGQERLSVISNGTLFDIDRWNNDTYKNAVNKYDELNDGYVDVVPITSGWSGTDLVLLDGVHHPLRYDFTNVTDLITGTTIVANKGLFTKFRLWLNDINEKSLIHFSAGNNATDFTSINNAGFLQVGSNTDPIYSMATLFMPNTKDTDIVLAKKNSIWSIKGSSGDLTTGDAFTPYETNVDEIGTISPLGISSIGEDVVIIGLNEINQFGVISAVTGLVEPSGIGDLIKDLFIRTVNSGYLNNSFIINSQKEGLKGRIYFFVPVSNSEYCNYCFVYDKEFGWYTRYWTPFEFSCATIEPNSGIMYLGSKDGKIYRTVNDKYSYDGLRYESLIDFGDIDFGISKDGKQIKEATFEIAVNEDISQSITHIYKTQNGFVNIYNELVDLYKYGAMFDVDDFDESLFDTEIYQALKLYPKGSFDKYSMQFMFNTIDLYFKIKSLTLQAEIP